MFKKAISVLLIVLTGCAVSTGQARHQGGKYDPTTAFKSVVKIAMNVTTPMGTGQISGTAWAADGDNLVTAGHVCDAFMEYRAEGMGGDYTITYLDDDFRPVEKKANDMQILFSDVANDVCIIMYSGHGLKPLKLAKDVQFGETAYVIGAPLGLLGFIFDGRVVNADLNMDARYTHKLIISSAATGGNSGGPVVNSRGEVIGMLIAGHSAFDHFSICTGLGAIRQILLILST
jgi:S1-C subfamily serine protease